MNYINELLKYTLAFCTGLFLLTYVLNIPKILTNNTKLVNEYYIDNFAVNVPLDYILVLLYLLVGLFVIYILKIKTILAKITTVVLVTGFLTMCFGIYFLSRPESTKFFSRWFHNVKFSAAIYDMILLGTIYSMYLFLDKYV